MVSTLVNLVKINCTTIGTGPLVLGSAVTGFRGVEALVDGAAYSYLIQQRAQFEYGTGAYDAETATLTRVVGASSNSNNPIALDAGSQVSFIALAADIGGSTGGSNIDDDIIASNTTWSSDKIDVMSPKTLDLRQFGGSTALANNASAWAAAIDASLALDIPILLAGGETYALVNPAVTAIPSGKTLSIIGDGQTALSSPSSATLFSFGLGGGSLVFTDIPTANISPFNDASNTMTTDIPLIDISGWSPTNTSQYGAVLTCLNTNDNHAVVQKLIARNIHGTGGRGGLHIRCQIMECEVSGSWSGIVVPNDDAGFSGNDMISTGNGTAFNIGRENSVGFYPSVATGHLIGPLSVDGVTDNRVKRGSGRTADCDGIRIEMPCTFAGDITVANVTSAYKTDTTGLYTKTKGRLPFINLSSAGHHEGSLSLKGASRAQVSGGLLTSPPGYPLNIAGLTVRGGAPGYNGRVGLYMSADDYQIGSGFYENVGGDIENPYSPGAALSGTRGVIYCVETPKKSLSMGPQVLRNCVLAAASGGPARAITMQGYVEQYWESIDLDGLSNAGLFSTQAAGDEAPLIGLYIDGDAEIDQLTIGFLNAVNWVKSGKSSTLIQLRAGAGRVKRLIINGGYCDANIDTVLQIQTGANVPDVVEFGPACRFGAAAAYITGPRPTSLIIQDKSLFPDFNLVPNSAFNDSTGITFGGTGWSVGGGLATHVPGNNGTMTQSITLTPGQGYLLEWDTVGAVGGILTPSFTGGTTVTAPSVTGGGTAHYQRFMQASSGNNALQFNASSSWSGSMDNLRLQAVG